VDRPAIEMSVIRFSCWSRRLERSASLFDGLELNLVLQGFNPLVSTVSFLPAYRFLLCLPVPSHSCSLAPCDTMQIFAFPLILHSHRDGKHALSRARHTRRQLPLSRRRRLRMIPRRH
jgi:hypothetical protein